MGLFDFLRSEKRGDNFLRAVFSGYGAANRTAVTRDTSLTFSAVFACVRVISESIASLPIKVYRVEDDNDKITDVSHPIYQLLARYPNEYMTPYTFLDTLMTNLLLEGNAYFYIERDSNVFLEKNCNNGDDPHVTVSAAPVSPHSQLFIPNNIKVSSSKSIIDSAYLFLLSTVQ